MYNEIINKEIDQTYDTIDILLLIRDKIFEQYNILLDTSEQGFKNDFEVRVEPNYYNPNDFPNIQIRLNHREVIKKSK